MSDRFAAVDALMADSTGVVFPGAVLRVAVDGEEVYHEAHGVTRSDVALTQVSLDTRYDIASLTKPMAVGTLAMKGVAEGWVELDARAGDHLPELEQGQESPLTIADLLAHRSGLPDWRPYLDWLFRRHASVQPGTPAAIEKLRRWVMREPLVYTTGLGAMYSDLGYMVLGWWLEAIGDAPLLDQVQTHVLDPLELEATSFIPVSSWDSHGAQIDNPLIAPTELCPGRQRLIVGEVHDENAYLLGGVAGHAGLFSTGRDVGRWADALLASATKGSFLPPETTARFWYPTPAWDDTTWRLAWDSPSPSESSGGKNISQTAVCHLGFTGCSVWIDPPRNATVVLLSNRVHPNRENNLIRSFRPELHDAIWDAIDGKKSRG